MQAPVDFDLLEQGSDDIITNVQEDDFDFGGGVDTPKNCSIDSTKLRVLDSTFQDNSFNYPIVVGNVKDDHNYQLQMETEHHEDNLNPTTFDGEDLGNHAITVASSCVDVIDSPGGNRYWIPDVPIELKPIKDVVFSSFEEAKRMYESYAHHSGFSTRLATVKRKKGEITHRYIVCNKAGKYKNKLLEHNEGHDDGITKRKTKTKVTNCLACVKFKAIPGTSRYIVYKFVEPHNHNLLEDVNKDFSKAKRKLQYADKQFIHSLSTTNTGPSTAYRMRTVSSGGQSRVHGNVVDFRNFRRDMNNYIGERDAQMLVDKMTKRLANAPDLSFDFKCEKNELVLLFWADEVYSHEIFLDVQNEIWKGVCNEEVFKSFLEVSSPEKVSITIPQGARNIGCGTNKRMIGPGEKVVAKIKKRNPRTCKICKKYVFHDSRTCALNPKNKKRELTSKANQHCSTSKQAEPDDTS
ncbi:hypothetical protein E3N88_37982 [Mikania micrantha]|uniref:FAR1 domain-containing protein n=1 Tax=Mikania micrantha TaxID=192012 RepID=A0A5N6LTH3_9ASTR|nr:hypothetical protein E3N88_37982 [Mikania micrantha]